MQKQEVLHRVSDEQKIQKLQTLDFAAYSLQHHYCWPKKYTSKSCYRKCPQAQTIAKKYTTTSCRKNVQEHNLSQNVHKHKLLQKCTVSQSVAKIYSSTSCRRVRPFVGALLYFCTFVGALLSAPPAFLPRQLLQFLAGT